MTPATHEDDLLRCRSTAPQEPTSKVMNMPPMPPAVAPRPTTEPDTFCGNRSVALVNRFADQAWWQAVASVMNATHVVKLCGVVGQDGTGHEASRRAPSSCMRALPTVPAALA